MPLNVAAFTLDEVVVSMKFECFMQPYSCKYANKFILQPNSCINFAPYSIHSTAQNAFCTANPFLTFYGLRFAQNTLALHLLNLQRLNMQLSDFNVNESLGFITGKSHRSVVRCVGRKLSELDADLGTEHGIVLLHLMHELLQAQIQSSLQQSEPLARQFD